MFSSNYEMSGSLQMLLTDQEGNVKLVQSVPDLNVDGYTIETELDQPISVMVEI